MREFVVGSGGGGTLGRLRPRMISVQDAASHVYFSASSKKNPISCVEIHRRERHIHSQCGTCHRYNISTADYDAWEVDYRQNKQRRSRNPGANIDLSARFGFSSDQEAIQRGYVFKNDPQVSRGRSSNQRQQPQHQSNFLRSSPEDLTEVARTKS